MSTLDLDAIRKRANAATPGPWVATNPLDDTSEWADDYDAPMVVTIDSTPGNYAAIAKDICQGPTDGVADVEFIANAREDIPALLAEVERLRARLDRIATTATEAAAEFDGEGAEIPARLMRAVAEATR